MSATLAPPPRACAPISAQLRRAPAWRTALLLGLAIWVAYLANFRYVSTGDSHATRYVPFSILMRGSVYVDGYVEAHFQPFVDGTFNYGIYFASQSRGHWVSNYPLLTPIAVTPLYVPAAWWLHHRGIASNAPAMKFWAFAMEKVAAATLAAISVTILFFALRRVATPPTALLLALVYGFASPTWSISAQALWLHAMTELAFALLLWALVSDDGSRRSAAWIGLALALAIANKLSNALVAAPVIVWFAVRAYRDPRRLTAFFVPLVALGSVVLAYNFYFFGSASGAYDQAFRTLGYAGISGGFHGSLTEGVAGNLISPSRGLVWYAPWALFAAWGAALAWRRWTWAPWISAGMLLHFLMFAKLERWWAGWSYGPRYLTDLMPLLAFFLVPLIAAADTRRWLRTALTLTFVWAFFVHAVGAYCYPNGEWNSKPTNIDYQPARLWDWHDPQILRTLRAGPMPTQLGERVKSLQQ